jgi:hypothetical protein
MYVLLDAVPMVEDHLKPTDVRVVVEWNRRVPAPYSLK